MRKHEQESIIDALGGTMAVARLCGVSPPTVSQWRKRGIPRGWLAFLITQLNSGGRGRGNAK